VDCPKWTTLTHTHTLKIKQLVKEGRIADRAIEEMEAKEDQKQAALEAQVPHPSPYNPRSAYQITRAKPETMDMFTVPGG
jgi:hypothetical protein